MKILISGASGLLGQRLQDYLKEQELEVSTVLRKENCSSGEICYNPPVTGVSPEKLEGFDCLIHLSGAGIADRRWSESYKKVLRDSRVLSTRLMINSLNEANNGPRIFLCASAVGVYGDRQDEVLTEDSSRGDGFLADLGSEWERELASLKPEIRKVSLRFGVILDPKGGALSKMLPIFKSGLAGKLGSGHQWMSWVHYLDVCRAIQFAIKSEKVKNALNVVAPHPERNKDFTKTLGRVLKRPTFLPAPAAALKLAMGEMGDELLLSSTRVYPQKLMESGFNFQFPELKTALKDLLNK